MTSPFGVLDALPRAVLSPAPTPLERLENLERALAGRRGVPRLYVKRDDMQGLAFGGNKVRQLEFYFGQARAQGADTVLITGAVQSNYCRLCAAFAAKLGMECHVQLEERVASDDPAYRASGNVLLDRLLGATLHSYPEGEDEAGADAQLDELAAGLRRRGRTPYVIHLGAGHPPLGALGYVMGARELAEQCDALGIVPDAVVVASGSGATHSGLLAGLRLMGRDTPVLGVCVRRDATLQAARIVERTAGIAGLLQVPWTLTPRDAEVTDEFFRPGYGRINDATREAISLGARHEALMLDPVYTGKAFAGFLDRANRGHAGETLVFVHTGGTPGLFAYATLLAGAFGWDKPD